MATRKREGASPAVSKFQAPTPGAGHIGDSPSFLLAHTETDAQMKFLEQGLRLFQEHRFGEAKESFERAATGPQQSVARTAKNHIVVCDRRTQAPEIALQTGDDHYNYGVERLNARDLEMACRHLEIAVSLSPNCEYMLYALAAALALRGDSARSCENLRRAIQGDPRNRNTARLDPDFSSVSHDPQFIALFYPDRA